MSSEDAHPEPEEAPESDTTPEPQEGTDGDGVPEVEQPAEDDPAPEETTTSSWRRIYLIARPRPTRANAFALLLALLLGFAIATQVRQTQAQGLENLRQDELVRILDDVTQNGNRLDDEVAELETTRDGLTEGEDNSPEAIAAAQERADTLGILSGAQAATGPGITLTITDDDGEVDAATLLDAVQELRDAGAEAMQVGDVRIVASTSFTDDGDTITADGRKLTPPYRFTVIGEPQTMSSAMEIPGGVSESVRTKGGEATVREFDSINVEALHSNSSPRYAQPDPDPEPTDGSN